jgi:hypothetical protein
MFRKPAVIRVLSPFVSAAWFGLGIAIAAHSGTATSFIREWVRLQGFFLLWLGPWLLSMASSDDLKSRLALLQPSPPVLESIPLRPQAKISLSLAICVIGSGSLIGLGFNASGAPVVFMWLTMALVCLLAGITTCHGIEIIIASYKLRGADVKLFSYSPAKTRSLRDLALYCASYGTILTIGYILALVATLLGTWQNNPRYVTGVQVFWPIVYVPFCLTVLIYPQLCLHHLVKRERERLMIACEDKMNKLLSNQESLTKGNIDEANALASLLEKISTAPTYVIDFSIAVRTIIPAVFNVVTLLIPRPMLMQWLEKQFLAVLGI